MQWSALSRKSPAEASSASSIATRVIVHVGVAAVGHVTHCPGPIVPTGCVGNAGVSVDSRGPTAGCTIVPGEPISPPAVKAPLTPATLRVEIVGGGCVVPPMPAALSKLTPAVAGAEADAGDPPAVGVEDVDLIAAGAEPDAGAAVGADLEAGRDARAEPGGLEGVRFRGCRPR